MTEHGSKSKHMIITVETETGKVVRVVDENNEKPSEVDPKKIEEISQSEAGFKYVGTILHAESSPGCVYFFFGGRYFRVCR